MKKLVLLFVLLSLGAQAQIADKIQSMKAHPGYFNFYYDDTADKIYLEVNATISSLNTAAGVTIAGGSDSPGYWPVDPLRDIATAASRKMRSGALVRVSAPTSIASLVMKDGIERCHERNEQNLCGHSELSQPVANSSSISACRTARSSVV